MPGSAVLKLRAGWGERLSLQPETMRRSIIVFMTIEAGCMVVARRDMALIIQEREGCVNMECAQNAGGIRELIS